MSIESIDQIESAQQPNMPELPRTFAVGDWRVYPELNRLKLICDGEIRQLEPRLIKLLCILAANEDRVLSREQLVQELWPRVIVNENSLTRAVSELRKQLKSANSAIPNYIETIPKRGYRLIPQVDHSIVEERAIAANDNEGWTRIIPLPSRWQAATLSAACLCLVVASWISLDRLGIYDPESAPVMLSDQVIDNHRDYLGGEIQLSTLDNDNIVVEAIESPVVSADEQQYAFIQYDTRGSTIFLGGLNTAIEPVPVYNSNRHLFNLAWSPVGNNLLFAMKPSMTTAAVYSPLSETAELVMLNLNTLETSRLVQDVSPADDDSTKGLNLT